MDRADLQIALEMAENVPIMKHVGFKALAVIVGVVALYLAFFLFEDSEGRSRDRIEDLWARIASEWKVGGSRLLVLFKVVAQAANALLDGLLGQRLVSVRSFGVSSSYALFGFWIASSLVLENHDYRTGTLQAAMAFLAFFCGSCPLFLKGKSATAISLCPCLAIPAIALGFSPMPFLQSFFVMLGLLLGFVAGFLTIVLQRVRIRRVCTPDHLTVIVRTILLQTLLPVLLFALPIVTDLYLDNDTVDTVTEILTYLNFSTELILLTFLIALALVIMHKVLWPVFGRFIYTLAQYRIVRTPAAMAALGIACLFAAFWV
jgi:hypothetical protein